MLIPEFNFLTDDITPLAHVFNRILHFSPRRRQIGEAQARSVRILSLRYPGSAEWIGREDCRPTVFAD